MKTLTQLYDNINEDATGLIEQLAEIEHDQWMSWAKNLMENETLSEDRIKRWTDECMMSYDELSEEMKEFDREWARKVVECINRN